MKHISDDEKKEKTKQQIIKRVDNMTIDEITRELLKENKLVLSAAEKEYARKQEKLFLIKKGARIEKQQYMNLKDLKALRQEERVQMAKQARQLREDGMISIDKNGKSHTVSIGINMSDRDIVAKKVNKRLYERAK